MGSTSQSGDSLPQQPDRQWRGVVVSSGQSVADQPPAHKMSRATPLLSLNLAHVHQMGCEREREPEPVVTERAGHRPTVVRRARCQIGALGASRKLRPCPRIALVAIAGLECDRGAANLPSPSRIRGSPWADRGNAGIIVRTRSPCSPPSQFHFAPSIFSDRVSWSAAGIPTMAGRRDTLRHHQSLAGGGRRLWAI
jgi:hypothetical protein